MSRTDQRVPTRLDEISKDEEEIQRRLKNFERIPNDELSNITIGTFLKFLRYKNGQWKYRSGGIVSFNGYPEYFCIKFRMKNGQWKPHNVNLTKEVIFFRQKKSEYSDFEIKTLIQSIQSGYLRLVRSDDLKKMTSVYNKVQKVNGVQKIPKLLHTDDLFDNSDSDEDCEDFRSRGETIVQLITDDDDDRYSSDD